MLLPDDAERLILNLISPVTEVETVDLANALGRILAAPITSQLDFPHWDNSAMDGYAVRYADVQQSPVTLTIAEEIPAGKRPQQTLQLGQAARIFTGSMMPDGADTIVIQEATQRHDHQVTILTQPMPRAFVRHQGSFCRAGDRLLSGSTLINAPEMAILAAAQCTQIPVYRRPRVAILSTGDELVLPDQPLQPGQIVDSNQYALAALVAQSGAVPMALGIVPDCRQRLQASIARALTQADLVISSGGVSVGDYDYIDQILADLGATLHIRAVAVKPGKPLTVATVPQAQGAVAYFGLPGNPVSSLVSFWRFVQPALRRLSGLQGPWSPVWGWATTDSDLKAGGQRETYLWGRLSCTDQGYRFSQAPGSHSSGNLINLAQTNGLAVIPIGTPCLPAGSSVRILIPQ
jgi:molybdopterin molybdotransferase